MIRLTVPDVDFEQVLAERLGVPHCVAVSSGTAAIHLMLAVAGNPARVLRLRRGHP